MSKGICAKMTIAVFIGVASLMSTFVAGCKKESTPPKADAPAEPSGGIETADASGGAGGGGAEAGGFVEPEDADEPIDPSMFGRMKSMMQLQVDGLAVQSQTMHQMLAQKPDAETESLLKQMDAKLDQAKKLMEQATSPAQSRTLRVDVPRLLGEAGELGAKAATRWQEMMMKATNPGGGR